MVHLTLTCEHVRRPTRQVQRPIRGTEARRIHRASKELFQAIGYREEFSRHGVREAQIRFSSIERDSQRIRTCGWPEIERTVKDT